MKQFKNNKLKIIFIFLILLSVFPSCYQYSYETRVFECMEENNSEINLTKIIEKLESVYIKHNILKSSEGISYVNLVSKFENSESSLNLDSKELKTDLNNVNIPSIIHCSDFKLLTDTIAYKSSRIFELTTKIHEIVESGYFGSIFLIFINLTETDFNHNYFKLTFLTTLTNYIQHPVMQRKLPPMPDENSEYEEIKQRNIMTVLIDSSDNILINNKIVSFKKIYKVTRKFFLNKNNDANLPEKEEKELPKVGKVYITKGVISLQTDRNTNYKTYLQVQNELVKAVTDLRNEFAQKHFGKNFDDLSEEDQDIAGTAFPLAISEAEPRRMTSIKN
jgi:biopolymer transport protein ExbD